MSERRERLDQAAREAVETWSKNIHDQRRLREVIIDAVAEAVDAEDAPLQEAVGKMLAWEWEGCPSLANAPATDMAAVRSAYLDLLAARKES